MEENKRKFPSLPPNYVTLVQLQELWTKEQQRKQNGKEEQVSEKSEVAVCVVSCESKEENVESEGLKKNVKIRRNWKSWRQKKREAAARAEDEVTGSETHAPQTSVEKEESVKSISALVADRSVEIERKFRDMTIHGGRERGSDRFVRPRSGSFYHCKNGGNSRGNWECRNDYRTFGNGRREEQKTRNAGMVWVKKGEVSGVNVGGFQSSSYSLKESE